MSTASSSLDNYDIPRNLGKPQVRKSGSFGISRSTFKHGLFQGANQLYDTPRSLKDSAQHGGAEPFGNYDFPQHGALPVFRKQCGCVLKLSNKSGAPFVTDCVHNGNAETLDAKAPRIKLTGTGKMPVVDMSEGFAQTSNVPNKQMLKVNQNDQSPVYAMVNKGTKAKTKQHNYCNIGPSLGDIVHEQGPLYENTKTILRPKGVNLPPSSMSMCHNYENTDNFLGIDVAANYVPMFPKTSPDCGDLASLPLIPFQPLNYDQLPLPGLPTPFDSINRKLRQLSDSLNPQDDANPGAIPIPTQKSKSIDQLHTFPGEAGPGLNRSQEQSGFVTVPRKTNRLAGGYQSTTSPAMRRSASVPCKNAENRGSTSSSDSGFSAGSPNGNPGPSVNVDYMLQIDSDHEHLESHSSQDLDETLPALGMEEEDTKV